MFMKIQVPHSLPVPCRLPYHIAIDDLELMLIRITSIILHMLEVRSTEKDIPLQVLPHNHYYKMYCKDYL